MTRIHFNSRWMVGLALMCFAMVLPFSTAYAHAHLRSSTPTEDAQLTMAPTELRLTFSEAPELAVSTIELTGPNGQPVVLGAIQGVAGSPLTLVAAVRGPLTAGMYTVTWKITGADGHPAQGEFSFTLLPGAQGLATPSASVAGEASGNVTAPTTTTPPAAHHDMAGETRSTFDAESPAYVFIRWFEFVALVVLLGTIAFHYFVLGFLRRREHFGQHPDSPLFPLARNRVARLGLWASIGFAWTAVLRLYAQSYAMHGASGAFNGRMIGTMLGHTVWGWGWILHAVAAALTITGFVLARRGSGSEGTASSRLGWVVAAIGAIAAAYTPALSGHAASSPQLMLLAVFADGLHIIGAGGWLGSLLSLVVVGIPIAVTLPADQRGLAVADLVNAFSPTALLFAGLVASTGVFAAWLHVGTVPALWQTPYGKTLLIKLAVLSVVAGTGAYNWLRVKPALGDVAGAARIRRSATVELAIGVIVLLITAVLVATPTAME